MTKTKQDSYKVRIAIENELIDENGIRFQTGTIQFNRYSFIKFYPYMNKEGGFFVGEITEIPHKTFYYGIQYKLDKERRLALPPDMWESIHLSLRNNQGEIINLSLKEEAVLMKILGGQCADILDEEIDIDPIKEIQAGLFSVFLGPCPSNLIFSLAKTPDLEAILQK